VTYYQICWPFSEKIPFYVWLKKFGISIWIFFVYYHEFPSIRSMLKWIIAILICTNQWKCLSACVTWLGTQLQVHALMVFFCFVEGGMPIVWWVNHVLLQTKKNVSYADNCSCLINTIHFGRLCYHEVYLFLFVFASIPPPPLPRLYPWFLTEFFFLPSRTHEAHILDDTWFPAMLLSS